MRWNRHALAALWLRIRQRRLCYHRRIDLVGLRKADLGLRVGYIANLRCTRCGASWIAASPGSPSSLAPARPSPNPPPPASGAAS